MKPQPCWVRGSGRLALGIVQLVASLLDNGVELHAFLLLTGLPEWNTGVTRQIASVHKEQISYRSIMIHASN